MCKTVHKAKVKASVDEDEMAECSSGAKVAERPSLLEEDLTCPVCRDLYREPVLLTCSHSFCKGCLEHSWQQKGIRECPVCRKRCDGEQPIPNRALRNTCESFQREKGWRVPATYETLCGLHRREMVLYCVKDEEPVCIDCVTLHRGHELGPLEREVPCCKDELNVKLNILDDKVDSFKRMKQKYNATIEYIRSQAQLTEKQIKMEFEKLHQFLNEEESSRIAALREEEEHKRQMMLERISSLSRDISALSELIQSIRRDMGSEDVTFLQNFQSLKRRAQWTADDPQSVPGALINVAKHLGALSYKVWEKMQSHITCLPVVMDPNTCSPWLCMTPDMAGVYASAERQLIPDNPERFDPCVFVVGSEGFTSGRHRWDVQVGDNPKWILGVCKESVARKRKFTVTATGGVWTIGLSKGVYNALTSPRTPLPLERRLDKIRVKLNMEKGEVSFWDPAEKKHICTFTDKFTERVFPLFGPGLHNTPMVVLPAKLSVNPV
ncbi:tripartite motif containing 35-28 [Megalops cyprinoides]|uniref:tripartite motif containing 35-28 n=1 Tax=Megalops cyprinoides TaxID=118141 RepID=UPI001863F068|nr:tripartite motif containing 35-28 [Megalops cyprinoides]